MLKQALSCDFALRTRRYLRFPRYLSRCVLFAFLLTSLFLSAPTYAERSVTWEDSLIDGTCSRFDDAYDDLFFDRDTDEWPDIYHEKVANVIDEYLQVPVSGVFDCTEESLIQLPENSELEALARTLPPWRDHPNVEITPHDLAPVLRRYLDAYECALVEKHYYVASDTLLDFVRGLLPISLAEYFGWDEFSAEIGRRRSPMVHEIQISRPALERTLAYVQTSVQFHSLQAELDCFLRASLDLRNVLALTVDAAMCLPTRTWDTRDSLRSL